MDQICQYFEMDFLPFWKNKFSEAPKVLTPDRIKEGENVLAIEFRLINFLNAYGKRLNQDFQAKWGYRGRNAKIKRAPTGALLFPSRLLHGRFKKNCWTVRYLLEMNGK